MPSADGRNYKSPADMKKYAIEMILIAECDDDERSPKIRRLRIHKIDTDGLPIPVANSLLNGIYKISEEKQ
jgi:hypothetical protein